MASNQQIHLTVKGARPFIEELKGSRAPLTASDLNVVAGRFAPGNNDPRIRSAGCSAQSASQPADPAVSACGKLRLPPASLLIRGSLAVKPAERIRRRIELVDYAPLGRNEGMKNGKNIKISKT